MPKSPSTRPDSPDYARTEVRAPADGGRSAEGSAAQSQRVRQLPPPPKVADELRLPRVGADGPQPAGWRAWWRRVGRRQSSSCAVSLLFHFSLLMVLGLLARASLSESTVPGLIAYTKLPLPLDSGSGDATPEAVVLRPGRTGNDIAPMQGPADPAPAPRGSVWIPPAADEVPKLADPGQPLASSTDPRRAGFGLQPTEPSDWLRRSDAEVRGALQGRRGEARAMLARRDGGTAESERAVEWGLRWLMAHQRTDGSWNFNHHKSACRGRCRNPGTEASTTAATAIALLAYLGAGYTHTEGEYQDVVQRAIYYLAARALPTPHGRDLQEGTMYAQGLSTIALCEAYAMTKEPALKDLAQEAIDFVVYAQDPKGGGWRYTPGQPGDTTVTGWQLMGLKSGQMAELEVPPPTVYLVQRFLSSVQTEDGALYGYMTPQPRRATTAIGLLCRMYTGWQHDHPALQQGVAYLSQWGPSEDNMYYNYYATQVMHHWGGSQWEQWNRKMRDHLIATQATTSHEAGSWYFSGGYGEVGGRLYNTAMAVMTLEVYYRYMPLYTQESVEGGF